jgi:hypothetical protein
MAGVAKSVKVAQTSQVVELLMINQRVLVGKTHSEGQAEAIPSDIPVRTVNLST